MFLLRAIYSHPAHRPPTYRNAMTLILLDSAIFRPMGKKMVIRREVSIFSIILHNRHYQKQRVPQICYA